MLIKFASNCSLDGARVPYSPCVMMYRWLAKGNAVESSTHMPCMIPFDWGLQYDPRGFLFISEMVSGIYVVQFDEDFDPRYNYPALWTIEDDD